MTALPDTPAAPRTDRAPRPAPALQRVLAHARMETRIQIGRAHV